MYHHIASSAIRVLSLIAYLTLPVQIATGQFEPTSAHVFLYFPQLADGGPVAQKWQTTVIFSNPNQLWNASCLLQIRSSNGQNLALDLGAGSRASHSFVIPKNGSIVLRSQAASTQTQVGWAEASCTAPVVGTILFRAVEQGSPRVEISAPAVSPAGAFHSIANRDLGIALANVYRTGSLRVFIEAYDGAGRSVSTATVDLCPSCHRAFNLRDVMPNLPSGFQGTISIESSKPSDVFVAWTLNSDRELLSSLPTGNVGWPISHYDRIWLVYSKLNNAARDLFPAIDFTRMRLIIPTDPIINASADSSGNIRINQATAELISDSPSELAFIVGHEIGHYVQFASGQNLIHPNKELDADAIAAFLSLVSGFDPYAGAGVFGKLMMASRRTGLMDQAFDNLASPHTSFSNRMEVLLETLTLACQQPGARSYCQSYKELMHPSFPADLPLAMPEPLPSRE